jgi:hypothetical protein
MGDRMPDSNDAFSRAKSGTRLRSRGCGLLDIDADRFEYVLPDETRADYVLCDRSFCRPADALAKAEATLQALLSRALSGDLTAAGRVRGETLA